MSVIGRCVALIAVLFLCHNGAAQIGTAGMDAKSVGYGGSSVIGVREPYSLTWNPSALGLIRETIASFAFRIPYEFNHAGAVYFHPQAGTIAAQLSRFSSGQTTTVGWARTWPAHLTTGAALQQQQLSSFTATTLSFGVLYTPPPARIAAAKTAPWYQRLWHGLTMTAAIQNIPLDNSANQPVLRLAGSYSLPWLGSRIIYGFHQSERTEFHQLALSMQPLRALQVFAGMPDFAPEEIAAGLEWQWQNLILSGAYRFESKQLWLTTSFRLGLSSRDQSAKAMEQARTLMAQGDKRKAYRYGRLALAYDEENEQARAMMEHLVGSVLNSDVIIDSMLTMANGFAAKRWFLSAAAQYHRVLKLDPENKRALEAMALIKAQVDQHIDRWHQLGLQYVQQGELATAREVFDAILLVRPDHLLSQVERDKINQTFNKQAEEFYYKGLGYYSQKNWEPAEQAFKQALELRPDWTEAQSYLWHIQQQKNLAEEELERLWKEAETLKAKGNWLAARRAYKAILDKEPNHSGAKAGADEAQAHLTVYVSQVYTRAETLYRNGDTENARRLFTQVLEINPAHAGARRYMEAINTSLSLPLQRLWERARAYANASDWTNCLQSVDSLLQARPQMAEAQQLRRRVFSALTADQLMDLARTSYLQSQFSEASALAMEALKKNPNHAAAQNLYSQSQKRIAAQVDEWYNRGIKLYTEEKYRSAIVEWDKVLAVNPDHEGAKDYKRRAQERLDALNRLP